MKLCRERLGMRLELETGGGVLTWLRVLMSVGGHSCPCLLGLCGSVNRPLAEGSGECEVSLPGPEIPSLWKAKVRQADLAIFF